jgi:hypothetical protein
MQQKRWVIGTVLIVFLMIFGLPCVWMMREIRQEQRNRALIAAIYNNDTRQVISLLNEGADANARDEQTPPPTFRQWLLRFVNRLRGRPPASPSRQPTPPCWSRHTTPISKASAANWRRTIPHLMYATKSNNLPIVRLLLAHRANTALNDKQGRTALSLAKANKNAALINLLEQAATKQ